MTTPQLPPLPETTYNLFYEQPGGIEDEGYQYTLDEPGYTADQMRAYALASLSTRPVAESIHAENAKTLQALVDELREMLGVKEGESLTASVRFMQEDRRSIATALARLARDYYGDPA